MITLFSPLRTRLIHISPSYWKMYRWFDVIVDWELFVGWNRNPMFYENPLLQKPFNLI